MSSVVADPAERHQLAAAFVEAHLLRGDRHAGNRLADLVEHAPGDHAHPRQHEVHVGDDLAVSHFHASRGITRTLLPVTEAQISAAHDRDRVIAGRQVGDFEPAIAARADVSRFLQFRRVHVDPRPPQRPAGIERGDPAANGGCALPLAGRLVARRHAASLRALRHGLGPGIRGLHRRQTYGQRTEGSGRGDDESSEHVSLLELPQLSAGPPETMSDFGARDSGLATRFARRPAVRFLAQNLQPIEFELQARGEGRGHRIPATRTRS